MLPLLVLLSIPGTDPQAKPDSAVEIRTIIERGIQAHGGEKQLEKLSTPWRSKVKGTAGKLEITGEILQRSPTQSKISSVIHLGPIATEVVAVSNGDKSWRSLAGFTKEITGKDLEEMQDGGYRHRVRNLLPLLRDPGLELSLLPGAMVSNQPAQGIRVNSKGHRDVDLYFDKTTGLVVKTESRVLTPDKPPVVLEQILSNYHDFDGLKMATRFTKYENGKQTSVEEYVDFTFVDHIDEHEFEKP